MRRLIVALLLVASTSRVLAAGSAEPAYFVLDGNPMSAKVVAHRVVRLSTQDASDLVAIKALESVAALSSASRLSRLDSSGRIDAAHLSPPEETAYGTTMFKVTVDGVTPARAGVGQLVWSGSTPFRAITLARYPIESGLRRSLVEQARALIAPRLDFRTYPPVGRRLGVEGPVRVRDYGRTKAAPDLAFVDVTWKIRDLPEALSNRGIDSMSSFLTVQFVVDRHTGRAIFRNVVNEPVIDDREMLLFEEPGGPLLMATSITCLDGAEPLLIDLEHETWGTGRPGDVPEPLHCFPAQ